jgi:hypothetical protein
MFYPPGGKAEMGISIENYLCDQTHEHRNGGQKVNQHPV